MPDIIELGRAKKAQRPGVYDHVSDLDLGKAIKLKFPDAYQDFTEFVGPRAPTDLPTPESTQPQSGPVGKFMDKAWEQVSPEPMINLGADLMAGASRTPEGAARTNQAVRTIANIPGNVLKSQADQFGKAKYAFTAGNYGQATAHAIGGVVPIVGPPLADAVQDISEGRTAEGFGTIAGIALPGVAKLGNRALQATKLSERATEAAAKSYTRALNPAGIRSNKMRADIKSAVHGLPSTSTSPAAPGLKETAPIALTRGSLHRKLEANTEQLGDQINQMQDAIPEGTMFIPTSQVRNKINQAMRGEFFVSPTQPIALPPVLKPNLGSAVSAGGDTTRAIIQASQKLPRQSPPVPTTRQTSGYPPGLGKHGKQVSTTPTQPTIAPPPPQLTSGAPQLEGSTVLEPTSTGWGKVVPAQSQIPPPPGSPTNPKFMGTIDARTGKPISSPPHSTSMIDYQVLRKIKQSNDRHTLMPKGALNPDMDNTVRVEGIKTATGAVRDVLNTATPEIAAVNKQFAVAKSAQDAIESTMEVLASRKEPISQRLANAVATIVVGSTGGTAPDMATRAAAAYAALNIHRLVRSTAWNTMSGATKAKLADLIESGDFVGVNGLLAAEGVGQVGKQIDPPPSENYKMGDSKKKGDQPLPKVGTTRTSPIGADEVVVTRDDLPTGALASQRSNTIKYLPQVFNDPNIRAHENIHIGQSRLAGSPTPEQIRRIFGNFYDIHKGAGRPQYEVPAYALAEPLLEPAPGIPAKNLERVRGFQEQNAKRVADYLNLLRLQDLGENGIAGIETSMHEPVLRKYLTGPIPPPPYTPNPILRDNTKPSDGYDPYLVGRKAKSSNQKTR